MVHNVTFEKLPEQHILIRDACVVYEPSVYGGDGSEAKKNIVLTVSPEASQPIRDIEDTMDQNRLISVLKEDTIKAKICFPGVYVYDNDKSPTENPTVWRDSIVNASILIKGRWASKTQTGLSLEVTDIQLLDKAPQVCPF